MFFIQSQNNMVSKCLSLNKGISGTNDLREPNLGNILSYALEFVIIQLSAYGLEYVHGQIESFHLYDTNSDVKYLTFDVSDTSAFQ